MSDSTPFQIELTRVLQAAHPKLAALYRKVIVGMYERLSGKFGPQFKGVFNSSYARQFGGMVRPVLARVDSLVHAGQLDFVISESALAKASDDYAASVIEQWAAKILAKLEGASISGASFAINGDFVVYAMKDTTTIRLEQRQVLNFSPLGKPYFQFPARIYCDGKFTPEKQLKALLAA